MKTLFTVHAGEFLVGSRIQQEVEGAEVWLPSKDEGVDLLITNRQHTRMVPIQVKFSRNYADTHLNPHYAKAVSGCGWWVLNAKKIRSSEAALWVLVLYDRKSTQYILIPPAQLHQRLSDIHGAAQKIQSYLWVTKTGKCWETRDLLKEEERRIADGQFSDPTRDFSEYLNAWGLLRERLR